MPFSTRLTSPYVVHRGLCMTSKGPTVDISGVVHRIGGVTHTVVGPSGLPDRPSFSAVSMPLPMRRSPTRLVPLDAPAVTAGPGKVYPQNAICFYKLCRAPGQTGTNRALTPTSIAIK